MSIKPSLSIIGYSGWCVLGFFRGINSYKYQHKEYNKEENYLYTNSFGYGFYGMLLYGNPVFLPITIYKEAYRLEVNIRNLEEDKKSKFYIDLF